MCTGWEFQTVVSFFLGRGIPPPLAWSSSITITKRRGLGGCGNGRNTYSFVENDDNSRPSQFELELVITRRRFCAIPPQMRDLAWWDTQSLLAAAGGIGIDYAIDLSSLRRAVQLSRCCGDNAQNFSPCASLSNRSWDNQLVRLVTCCDASTGNVISDIHSNGGYYVT